MTDWKELATRAREALRITCDAAKKRVQRGRRELIGRLKKDPYCREALCEMGR